MAAPLSLISYGKPSLRPASMRNSSPAQLHNSITRVSAASGNSLLIWGSAMNSRTNPINAARARSQLQNHQTVRLQQLHPMAHCGAGIGRVHKEHRKCRMRSMVLGSRSCFSILPVSIETPNVAFPYSTRYGLSSKPLAETAPTHQDDASSVAASQFERPRR